MRELLYYISIMNVKDAVAIRIKDICIQKGLKYNELANLSGITPSTIYSIMDSTRRNISLLTVKKICDGLDISLVEFFDAPIFYNLEQEIR